MVRVELVGASVFFVVSTLTGTTVRLSESGSVVVRPPASDGKLFEELFANNSNMFSAELCSVANTVASVGDACDALRSAVKVVLTDLAFFDDSMFTFVVVVVVEATTSFVVVIDVVAVVTVVVVVGVVVVVDVVVVVVVVDVVVAVAATS